MSKLFHSYYRTIYDYREAMKAASHELETTKEKLITYKGSSYYEKKMQEAHQAYKDEHKRLAAECMKKINDITADMQKAIDNRKIAPPIPENLQLLQVLSLRSNISLDDLRAAARTMAGDDTALAALGEIAAKHGHPQMSNLGLTPAGLSDCIRALKKNAAALCSLEDLTNNAQYTALRSEKFNPSALRLNKDNLSASEMFRYYGSTVSYDGFCKVLRENEN